MAKAEPAEAVLLRKPVRLRELHQYQGAYLQLGEDGELQFWDDTPEWDALGGEKAAGRQVILEIKVPARKHKPAINPERCVMAQVLLLIGELPYLSPKLQQIRDILQGYLERKAEDG